MLLILHQYKSPEKQKYLPHFSVFVSFDHIQGKHGMKLFYCTSGLKVAFQESFMNIEILPFIVILCLL